jgi:hypothetical protein
MQSGNLLVTGPLDPSRVDEAENMRLEEDRPSISYEDTVEL